MSVQKVYSVLGDVKGGFEVMRKEKNIIGVAFLSKSSSHVSAAVQSIF